MVYTLTKGGHEATEKTMSLRQRYLQLALISLAGGAIYPLVYLRQNFELSLLEALGISAAELQPTKKQGERERESGRDGHQRRSATSKNKQ